MEKKIYLASDGIIALSPPISDYIRKRVPQACILTAPNFSDNRFFGQAIKSYSAEDFVIGYIGTIGEANSLEYLIHCATKTQELDLKVSYFIMGDGKEKTKIERAIKNLSLKNVTLHGFDNYDGVLEVLKKCDAAYISFRNIPVLETGSPNKFFDALAAGKIIILNFNGWIGDIVEQYQVGFSYDPHNPKEFVSKIVEIIDEPEKVRYYSMNARNLAKTKFDSNKIISEVVDFSENFMTNS